MTVGGNHRSLGERESNALLKPPALDGDLDRVRVVDFDELEATPVRSRGMVVDLADDHARIRGGRNRDRNSEKGQANANNSRSNSATSAPCRPCAQGLPPWDLTSSEVSSQTEAVTKRKGRRQPNCP